MNNFIKKLSQRELGFIYLFLGLIIHYLSVIFPLVEKVIEKMSYGSAFASLFVLSVLGILKLFLIVTGLIKIFSKTKKEDVNIEQNLPNIKEIKFKSIAWVVTGILLPILSLLIVIIPHCETEECKWGSLLLGVPFVLLFFVIGTVFIIIGIVKLNKYFKYKKLQQVVSEIK
jgi:membrane protease YdiL (CAAX protease family)